MTNEKILKKAIEKAIKNGWSGWVCSWKVIKQGNYPYILLMGSELGYKDAHHYIEQLIFDHSFAKSFWGDKLVCYDCGEKVSSPDTVMNGRVQLGTGNCKCSRQFENNEYKWQYELKMMVLEEEPLKYLEKFL